MSMPFVHLRLHSEYSLVDGLVQFDKLFPLIAREAMGAVALTDQSNFFGLIKFFNKAQHFGIKPICGVDLWVEADAGDKHFRLLLLAKSALGYDNLRRIVSLCYCENQQLGKAVAKKAWLEQYREDIIALSGGVAGDLGHALLAGNKQLATQRLAYWMRLYPQSFYLELMRTQRANEATYIPLALELAIAHGCPVVATNDVCFLREDDFEAHEARVCIGQSTVLEDPKRSRAYSKEQYFKSTEQMAQLFADIPSALENSVEIAKRCNIDIALGKYFLPQYPVPEGKTLDAVFTELATEGLKARLSKILDTTHKDYAMRREAYFERLRFELNTIVEMGFPGYFLIVMDFIRWAKERAIPVGPGRGSGAGSLVAFALKITDIDPLSYDLLFERFLNPERVSLPDFDIDFCMEGRDLVINYVIERYGREAVAQIITFGTMAAKAVVRDVARVQGKSYGLADRLSKMIPFEIGMTLTKARQQESSLDDFLNTHEESSEIWEMALKLEGVVRNVGRHAGGVVIAPARLVDFVPLYCDEDGQGLISQFDKNDVELAGLLKFDFLGLRTLTIIDRAVNTINGQRAQQGLKPLIMEQINLVDKKAYACLQKAETTAVFQLESRGMKDLIKRLLPSCFEDIIALVALFRPGPLQSGMVDDFINRKHGLAKVSYPHPNFEHPSLVPILKSTYGVIVYQEQVMQIAQVLAGYSLGEADLLRRAMGKKKPEEMVKQRKIFAQGAQKKGNDPKLAMRIFDLVEKFAGYGFNKSHSAAYALISYQTLWLKVHYPAAFMAAVLSSEMHNSDKVVALLAECRRLSIEVLPPDVNHSEYYFTVCGQQIAYGLGAVKGMGEGSAQAIVEAREDKGPFTDIFDFCYRLDSNKINRRVLEALIRAGALDKLGPQGSGVDKTRAVLTVATEDALKAVLQSSRNHGTGLEDMFGGLIPQHCEHCYHPYDPTPPWVRRDRLQRERATLGFYLTGHPIDDYAQEARRFVSTTIDSLQPSPEKKTLCGIIETFRVVKNRQGEKMAFVSLDDSSGRLEVAFFSSVFQKYEKLLQKHSVLVVQGVVSLDQYAGVLRLKVENAVTFEQARELFASELRITLRKEELHQEAFHVLRENLSLHPGSLPVVIDYRMALAKVELLLADQFQVRPSENFLKQITAHLGQANVTVVYPA